MIGNIGMRLLVKAVIVAIASASQLSTPFDTVARDRSPCNRSVAEAKWGEDPVLPHPLLFLEVDIIVDEHVCIATFDKGALLPIHHSIFYLNQPLH
ncbi:hypothetical protein ACHAWX_000526 [Stephanocyclus meneghinianus]